MSCRYNRRPEGPASQLLQNAGVRGLQRLDGAISHANTLRLGCHTLRHPLSTTMNWGVLVHDDRLWFEFLVLEGA